MRQEKIFCHNNDWCEDWSLIVLGCELNNRTNSFTNSVIHRGLHILSVRNLRYGVKASVLPVRISLLITTSPWELGVYCCRC